MPTVIHTSNTGNSGERVAGIRLEQSTVIHRIAIFGGVWPVIDAYIEFEQNQKTYYFFVQIKTTTLGPQGSGPQKSLEIELEKEKHEKLGNHFGPTYLIGVDLSGGSLSSDEKLAMAYICTVREEIKKGVYSIPVSSKHELNKVNVEKLYNEVVDFWETTESQKENYKSNFAR